MKKYVCTAKSSLWNIQQVQTVKQLRKREIILCFGHRWERQHEFRSSRENMFGKMSTCKKRDLHVRGSDSRFNVYNRHKFWIWAREKVFLLFLN